MVAENKKFSFGDKVITVKNTPDVQEGWVGYISGDGGFWGWYAENASSDGPIPFKEDELELLGVGGKKIIREEGVLHNVEIKATVTSALDKQVSGNHYKDCGIQPIEYIHANGLSYLEGNVIKYTTRHSKKNGKADIEKAIHYLELILEMEYKGETE